MTSSPPLVIFLCYARGQGLLHHLADWLTALTDLAGTDFEIIGLSEPEEQDKGLYDSLRRRGVTNLQIVQSLSDPISLELLSRATLVHCHGFQQLADLSQLRRKIRASFRCVISIHYFRNGTVWKLPFTNYISGTLLNKTAPMIHFLSMRSHSEFNNRNFLLRRALPYYIFPLGCDETEFAEIDYSDQPPEWQYLSTLAADKPNIVYLAAFTRNKQHRWLVDALAPILIRRNALLWLMGDGPELLRIREYIHKQQLSDHVICPGCIERRYIPWLLSYMQVAVCTSLSENSPHAIMEPLFAGVPVVTFDVGTASQLVSDFSTGFLLGKPRSKEEFARKIDIILCDSLLQRHMAEDAKHFVTQYYSWHVCAGKTLAMYRSTLQE